MLDAIIVDEHDNVATAIRDLSAGPIETNLGQFTAATRIPVGHKVALRAIAEGEFVIKYGDPVGRAQSAIAEGELAHVQNVSDILPAIRRDEREAETVGYPAPRESRRPTWDPEELRATSFNGFRRADGQVGVRNLILVVSTVGCANLVAERVAAETGAVPITHQQGCLQLGVDLALTQKQLTRAALNPNVGAVLFVSLGCETMQPGRLMPSLHAKPTESVSIQSEGGTRKAVQRGIQLVNEMKQQVDGQQRTRVPVSELIVGTKCGGSDAFSGLTANPACGVACDMLVDAGAAVLLSETPGLFGSEPHLAARMKNREDRRHLRRALDGVWDESLRLGEKLSEGELSPGNIKGGLTTLVEKSLGATTKAGTRAFQGFLEFADPVPRSGLWLMDTPGFDVITISGQAAGGAQIILFTTGRGSPVGCALAPVLKVCSNTTTFELMDEDMDINAGAIISEDKTIEEVGREIFDAIVATANGTLTRSESLGHREFALARIGSTL